MRVVRIIANCDIWLYVSIRMLDPSICQQSLSFREALYAGCMEIPER